MKNKPLLFSLAAIFVVVSAFFLLKKNEMGTAASVNEQGPSASDSEQGTFRVTPADPNLLIRSHSPIQGPFSSKVTIVEFLDPECEACRAMHPIVKKVIAEFGDQVRLVVRYMPFHRNSKLAANVLEGAREENRYWEALELLFEHQPEWADHHNPQPERIPQILAELNLDTAKIMKQAKAGKFDEQIELDRADGEKLGVNATPTFFINGQKLEEMGYAPLREAVANQLTLLTENN